MALLQRSGPSSMNRAPDRDAAPGSGAREAGEALRRQRKALGLDLDEVAAVLRIKPGYLAALEAGRPEHLPGYAYAVGFARTYGDWLGLDADEVLRRLKEGSIGFSAKPKLSFPMPPGERHMPGSAALLTAMILAVCGYGIWYYLSTAETRSLERIAPVPAELLAHSAAAPPAFGTSSPVERAGSRSDAAGPAAAAAAPLSPAAPKAAHPPTGRPIRKH
jgi:cytoskeleton protein RodZ